MSLESKIPKDARILVMCVAGENRSPRGVEYLLSRGYENADFAAAGAGFPLDDTQKRIGWAQVIITLDPRAARMLGPKYSITLNPRIINLDIPEWTPKGEVREMRTEEDIYSDIAGKMEPYLI